MSGAVAAADTEAAHGGAFVYTRALPGLMDGGGLGPTAASSPTAPGWTLSAALPDAVISRDYYNYRLLAECQRQTGNPDFGLALDGCRMGNYAPVLYLASGKTLQGLAEHVASVTSRWAMSAVCGSVVTGRVSRWCAVRPPGPRRCAITDNIHGHYHCRWTAASLPVRPRRVDLSYAQPGISPACASGSSAARCTSTGPVRSGMTGTYWITRRCTW